VKCAKPEPEIYEILIERFSLTPEKAVFIDDLEENIEAAKDVGLQGIVFKSPDQLKGDLKGLGIEL